MAGRRSRNLSVAQFQQLLERLPQAITAELQQGLEDEAERMAGAMRKAVPLGTDGRNELLESIRVERSQKPLRVLVKAGGPLTTKEVRAGSGVPYDYSLANEFGTQKMIAQPFFWPTYRLLKKSIRSAIARRATKAMAKVIKVE